MQPPLAVLLPLKFKVALVTEQAATLLSVRCNYTLLHESSLTCGSTS